MSIEYRGFQPFNGYEELAKVKTICIGSGRFLVKNKLASISENCFFKN